MSRRRAYEALVLAAYWQDKADRITAGGPAYRTDDSYLAAAFEAVAAAAATTAATGADLAARDGRAAVADAATPDNPHTAGVDERTVGRVRAAGETDRAAGEHSTAAAADGEAAAAQRAARVVRGRLAPPSGSSPASTSSTIPRPPRRTARCIGPHR